jgi:cytochrome c
MSGFELNKIAGSILLASLIAMVSATVVNILYKPNLHPKQRGYEIAVSNDQNTSNAPPAPETPLDIPALMKIANADVGEVIVKKCVACHSLDKGGPNKVGPHLWNVIGRAKGSVEGYNYSAAMTAKGGKWDYEDLFHMLHKPSQFLPGTKMSFAGISKPEDVANVIEYLRLKAHDTPAPPLP